MALLFCDNAVVAGAEASKGSPAKIDHPVKESDLTKLTLTPEAEKRLGIALAVVERKKIERTRTLGGETIVPLGSTNRSGTSPESEGRQSVFGILPSASPAELIRIAESQIDAEGQIDRAKVQFESAKVIADRTEKLVREKAGSVRALDEAKAQVALAEATLRTAQARRELLGPPVLEIANPKRLWVRVPIYVGDLARLKADSEVRVGELASGPAGPTRPAKPVASPPSANPSAATIDLFYEVSNEDRALRLGQKVGVAVPLREPEESLVVPWSAVVHDINGGTWVYENSAPQTYVRRRVQLRGVLGQEAALGVGPKPGTKVVTAGVAELFGTEFGVGK